MDNDFDPENVDAFEDGTAAVLRDLGGGLGPDATLAAANKSKLRRPAILDDPVYRGKVISAKEVLRRGEASEEEDSAEEDDELEEASDDSSEEEESGDGSAAAASAPSRGTDAISAQLAALKREDAASLVGASRTNEEEMKRSLRARNQQQLWNTCLEVRIMLQQLLSVANQMPQGAAAWETFSDGAAAEIAAAKRSASSLATSLIGVQDTLLRRDAAPALAKRLPPPLAPLTRGGGSKREEHHHSVDALLAQSAALWTAFEPQHDAVITQWSRRANVLSGSALQRKQFKLSSLDQGVIEQVNTLLADREPLLKRTRRRRSQLRVFGEDAAATAEQAPSDEIFDDSDFYRNLLRELLESGGASGVSGANVGAGLGRAEEKKRAKKRRRKEMERKASKGRKVRVGVLHPKLANFMGPTRPVESAIDADELFASLFAQ